MFLELIVAAAATAAGPALPPLDPATRAQERRARQLLAPRPPRLPEGRLPHGGRACLILTRCDPRPCILLVERPRTRCGPPHRRPAPRTIPARG